MTSVKYILSVVVLSALIALGGYYYFGGFTAREQQMVEVNDYHLTGRHFKGRLDSPELEKIFYQVRSRHEKEDSSGVLTIVTFKEPLTAKDTVEQFIGILTETPDTPNALPQGWENITIEARHAVRNTIQAHNLVMPDPQEIKEEIQEFSREHSISLQPNISIEKYLGERHLEVEVPVKN